MNIIRNHIQQALSELTKPVPLTQEKSLSKVILGIEIFLLTVMVATMISVVLTSCSVLLSKKCAKYETVSSHKDMFHDVAVNYKDKFTCDIKEIELVLGLLLVSETTTKVNRKWTSLASNLVSYNNLFGFKASKAKIKAKEFVVKNTWEIINGKKINISDEFATFKSKEECVNYWFTKITSEPRYKRVLKCRNYAEVLIQLQVCGYMTDNLYPQKMLNISKDINLDELFSLN